MSGLVRRGAVVLAAIAIGAGAAWLALRREPLPPGPDLADLPGECAVVTHEGSRHVVCEIDPRRDEITVRHAGPDGKAFGSLDAFATAARAAGRPVGLAMNAGMYHEDMSPVGLLVEDDRELSPLATGEGAGNFFLKPNGVFLIDADGKAAVMETAAYAAAGLARASRRSRDRCWSSTARCTRNSCRTASRVMYATAWAYDRTAPSR